jgi:hypothetical protein
MRWGDRLGRTTARRWMVAIGVLVVLLLVAVAVALFFIDEPLRRYTEAKMNASLKGYTAHIGKLHFGPTNFSMDLRNVIIVQNEHPDPPVANFERIYASVHWKALLHGRVVGDVQIEHPVVVLNLTQARSEINDPTPVTDKGWQDALQSIYPLKINELRITQGDVTYQDRGPFKPLRVYDIDLTASNIRNVRSEEGVYPSPMRLTARIFDEGSVAMDGWADFLAEPYAAFLADIDLKTIALDYFKPITNRYNTVVDKGTLSAAGEVEISPALKSVRLWSATVDGIHVDYLHTPAATPTPAKTAARETVETADKAQQPGLQFRVDKLEIVKSNFGYVDKTKTPNYRVFLSDASASLTNLSSLQTGETATAKVRGKFMGSGPASADLKILPERPGPDFNLALQIDDTDLTTMNDLLRAYGKFDVTAGEFSLYSELRARDRQVNGYVKPLFQDMTVYDPQQDKGKGALHKAYEAVVGGVSKILKNRPREEVATRVELSGRLDNPNTSTLAAVAGLVQNAFFKAILPGFDAQLRRFRR